MSASVGRVYRRRLRPPGTDLYGYVPRQKKKKKGDILMKYVCDVCGYVYDEELGDPDNGIEPGTKWEDLPDDFTCPLCSVGKDQFSAQ